MMSDKRVIIHPEAKEEARDARLRYSTSSPDTAHRFQNAVDNAIQQIREHPAARPVITGDIHGYLVSRFPYAIMYRLTGETIEILAFAHTRRRPGYWRHRR